MSFDLATVTGSVVAALPGVQACLLVSRDGLPLCAFPGGEERRVTEMWHRLAELGDVRRGFVVVGEEMWAFSLDESYGALAIAQRSTRPALILDRLDRALAALHADAVTPMVPAGTPDRPETVDAPPAPATEDKRATRKLAAARLAEEKPDREEAVADPGPETAADGEEPGEVETAEPERTLSVDVVGLAREFAGLIPQEDAG